LHCCFSLPAAHHMRSPLVVLSPLLTDSCYARLVYLIPFLLFFLNETPPPESSPLSLHDALPIPPRSWSQRSHPSPPPPGPPAPRSEEHTSELQSLTNLVCRLLLEKKKTKTYCSAVIRKRRRRVAQ